MTTEDDLTNENAAFPIVCFNTQGMPNVLAHGMTLRDYFAGQALLSMRYHGATQYKDDAEACYKMADAMLKARRS